MSDFDEFKAIFFEEGRELLQAAENDLMELRDGNGGGDTVNAIFRAVHSIKGGAGAFGYDRLVSFAHVFETVMDEVRNDRLPVTEPLVDLMLRARDVLSDLTDATEAGDQIGDEVGADIMAELSAVLDGGTPGSDDTRPTNEAADDGAPDEPNDGIDEESFEFDHLFNAGPESEGEEDTEAGSEEANDGIDAESFEFDHLFAGFGENASAESVEEEDQADGDRVAGEHGWRVLFRPGPSLLRNANEPLALIRELRRIGDVSVSADISGLPGLDDLDPLDCSLSWVLVVAGEATREQIEEVFEFVADEGDFDVQPWTGIDLEPGSEFSEIAGAEVDPTPISAAGDGEPSFDMDFGPTDGADEEPLFGEKGEVLAFAVTSSPNAAGPRRDVTMSPPATVRAATVQAATVQATSAKTTPTKSTPPAVSSLPKPPAREGEKAGPPATSGQRGGDARAASIRVDLNKVDRVANMAGELVITQAMLSQIIADLPDAQRLALLDAVDSLDQHTRELQESIMSMRAQPVRTVFQRVPRLIRELATQTGKKVKLDTVGETTEVDTTVIEQLGDPLTHMIRNAIDHGLESPEDRIAAGKPETGTVRLSAEHKGGRIVIEVRDDGKGIDRQRVFSKAVEKGLIEPDARLSDDEIDNMIFHPGFSTASSVSNISGRGVGMDVVKKNIQDLGGRVSIRSTPGRGSVFQLTLPLTLAVMDGMVVSVGEETLILPLQSIVECLRPTHADISHVSSVGDLLRLRGEVVSLIRLADCFNIDGALEDPSEGVVVVVDLDNNRKLGIIVDDLLGQQQVVIKSIEENYGAVDGVAAATILGNGRVALIVDVDELGDRAPTQTPAIAMAG